MSHRDSEKDAVALLDAEIRGFFWTALLLGCAGLAGLTGVFAVFFFAFKVFA